MACPVGSLYAWKEVMGAGRGRKREKREGRTFVEATPATPPGGRACSGLSEGPVGVGLLSRPAPPHIPFTPAFLGERSLSPPGSPHRHHSSLALEPSMIASPLYAAIQENPGRTFFYLRYSIVLARKGR